MSLLDSIKPVRRGQPTPKARKLIFKKTGGLCHICGGALGKKWSADHVMPVAKGGKSSFENYLPSCYTCNRLKWHRTPEVIRLIMQLGIYARKQIQHDTPVGRKLAKIFKNREKTNRKRRKREK